MSKAKEQVTKDVNVAKLDTPAFLTLTGKPANEVAFKIVRSAEGGPPKVVRTRKTRSDALLCIDLPDGATAEDAEALAADFGLTGYSVTETDGKISIRRNDMPEKVESMAVKIGNGRVAHIIKPHAAGDKAKIGLVSIEFAKDYFETTEEVKEWFVRNDIDFDESRVQNGDLAICVACAEAPADAEKRQMTVEGGVSFVVVRADESNLPEQYVQVVNETAYGSWGWGQLDFAARLADVEFCRMADEAIYTLRDLVERIIFWSDLPLATRKELVVRATTQFSEFVSALMDALPQKVVIVNRSNLEKEKSMGQKQEQKDVARQDDAATQTANGNKEGGATAAASDAGAPITRGDVEKMIGDAVAGLGSKIEGLAARLPAPATPEGDGVKRSDEQGASKTDPMVEAMNSIAKSVEAVSASAKSTGEVVAALAKRLDVVESQTTVRSDAGDAKQDATKRKDIFAGAFGNRRAESQ